MDQGRVGDTWTCLWTVWKQLVDMERWKISERVGMMEVGDNLLEGTGWNRISCAGRGASFGKEKGHLIISGKDEGGNQVI